MALKILVPVLPSERFYDAVVASADLIAEKGGTMTFLFTSERPPPIWAEKQASNTQSEAEVAPEREDEDVLDEWQANMIEALADARDLCYERGVEDDQLNYAFADFETVPAQSIADEAAAGSYDLVVLSKSSMVAMPDMPGEGPLDIASEIQALADDGVRLLVT